MLPSPLVEVQHLSVKLAGISILDGISFDIPTGSFTGLIGPNGSGKTTLLRTLSGVLPFQGQIHIQGKPLQQFSPKQLAHSVAFLAQHHPTDFAFTVLETTLLGRSPHKRLLEPYTQADYTLARQALQEVELIGYEDRFLHTLSGGELQRVFLAQALVQQAPLLLLDEPTSHLDIHHQYAFMERIRCLTEEGFTALGVFHDLNLAARYTDHLIVLHKGRIFARGRPMEVLTPSCIRQVFRMEARIQMLEDQLNIIFLHPIHATEVL